jgi:hypothetical protein
MNCLLANQERQGEREADYCVCLQREQYEGRKENYVQVMQFHNLLLFCGTELSHKSRNTYTFLDFAYGNTNKCKK